MQHPPDAPASGKTGHKRKKCVHPLRNSPGWTHEIRHRWRAWPIPLAQRRHRFLALIWNHPNRRPAFTYSGPVETCFRGNTEPATRIVNEQAGLAAIDRTIRQGVLHDANRLPPGNFSHQDAVVAAG